MFQLFHLIILMTLDQKCILTTCFETSWLVLLDQKPSIFLLMPPLFSIFQCFGRRPRFGAILFLGIPHSFRWILALQGTGWSQLGLERSWWFLYRTLVTRLSLVFFRHLPDGRILRRVNQPTGCLYQSLSKRCWCRRSEELRLSWAVYSSPLSTWWSCRWVYLSSGHFWCRVCQDAAGSSASTRSSVPYQ